MTKLFSRKKILVLATALFLIMAFGLNAFCATLLVSKDEGQYSSIQSAIDSSESGDIVRVNKGTYEENLIIDKDLTIEATEASGVTIKGSREGYPVVKVGPSNVKVTLQGIILLSAAGDRCEDKDEGFCPNEISTVGNPEIILKGVTVEGSIYLRNSVHARIVGSDVSKEGWIGVWVGNSANLALEESTISDKSNGIRAVDSANVTVKNSTLEENEYGIRIRDSAQFTIKKSIIKGNDYGIWLGGLTWAVIENNEISANRGPGIQLRDTAGARVTNNTIRKNDIGIEIYLLEAITVNLQGSGNKIVDNDRNFQNVPKNLQNILSSE